MCSSGGNACGPEVKLLGAARRDGLLGSSWDGRMMEEMSFDSFVAS